LALLRFDMIHPSICVHMFPGTALLAAKAGQDHRFTEGAGSIAKRGL
jgi:hypothetical protein